MKKVSKEAASGTNSGSGSDDEIEEVDDEEDDDIEEVDDEEENEEEDENDDEEEKADRRKKDKAVLKRENKFYRKLGGRIEKCFDTKVRSAIQEEMGKMKLVIETQFKTVNTATETIIGN